MLGDCHRHLLNDHGSRGQGGVNGPTDNRRTQKWRYPAAAVATVAVAVTTVAMTPVAMTPTPALTSMETTADRDSVVRVSARKTLAVRAGVGRTGSCCKRAEKGQRNPMCRNMFHDVDLSGIQVPDVLSVQVFL